VERQQKQSVWMAPTEAALFDLELLFWETMAMEIAEKL
jgi:hypothetical protein